MIWYNVLSKLQLLLTVCQKLGYGYLEFREEKAGGTMGDLAGQVVLQCLTIFKGWKNRAFEGVALSGASFRNVLAMIGLSFYHSFIIKGLILIFVVAVNTLC